MRKAFSLKLLDASMIQTNSSRTHRTKFQHCNDTSVRQVRLKLQTPASQYTSRKQHGQASHKTYNNPTRRANSAFAVMLTTKRSLECHMCNQLMKGTRYSGTGARARLHLLFLHHTFHLHLAHGEVHSRVARCKRESPNDISCNMTPALRSNTL